MGEIANLQAASHVPMTPFSAPWLSRLRRGMGSINGKPALMSGMEPTEQERAQIPGLLSTLKRQLSAGPSDRQGIAAELANMFAAFPAQDQSDTPAALRIGAYFDALSDAPVWAIRQARLKVISGEYVGSLDSRFAPTPPQFAGIVRSILKPLRDDLADLEKISAAVADHVPSAEERARVAQGFEDLKHSLPSGQKREAQTEAALAAHADAQLRQRLRDNGMSEDEVEATMNSFKPAEPRPGSFASLKRTPEAA
jgi:hypothetical protein